MNKVKHRERHTHMKGNYCSCINSGGVGPCGRRLFWHLELMPVVTFRNRSGSKWGLLHFSQYTFLLSGSSAIKLHPYFAFVVVLENQQSEKP